MKHTLSIGFALLLVLFTCQVKAQKFTVGIEGGVNARHFLEAASANGKQSLFAFGFNNQLWLKYDIHPRVGVQLGVGSVRKGTVYTPQATNIEINALHTNLDYAVMPLLVNLYLTPERRLFVQAGVYFGVLTAAKQFYLSGSNSTAPQDIRLNFKNTDFGSVLGVGYRLAEVGNFGLYALFSNYLGFKNIALQNPLTTQSRNITFDARVGLTYALGQK